MKWSTQAFTDEILEDSLNNSRKAGETNHYMLYQQ